MILDQPTIDRITRLAVRLYGEGMYLVRLNNTEAVLERPDGEVLYRASALAEPSHLAALERLLERRAERLS